MIISERSQVRNLIDPLARELRLAAYSQMMAHSPLLAGLSEELASLYPNEPRAAIEKALTDALNDAAAVEGLANSDVECKRDYSSSCPQGAASRGRSRKVSICSAGMRLGGSGGRWQLLGR